MRLPSHVSLEGLIVPHVNISGQVVREKQLLAKIQPHPLIVRLESAMQDKNWCVIVTGGPLLFCTYNS